MKYKTILILILSSVLIISSIVSQPDVEIVQSWQLDKEKRDLFKKLGVKIEIEIIKKSSETDSLQNSAWTHKYYYDKNGNKLRREFYTDSLMNKLYYEEDYVTDKNGNVLEAYRKGKLIGTQEFDDEGRIVELINYDNNNEENWTWEYEYDEMGKVIFETQYLYDELIDTLLYYDYDYEYENINDKILIKSKICLLDTSDIFYDEKEIFSYDILGREIQYKKFRNDNSVYYYQTTNYETLSRKRIFYFPNGSIERVDSMKINSEGNVLEKFTYKDGIPIKTTELSYDDRGLILSELRLSTKSSLHFQYHYNDLGQEIYFGSFVGDSLKFLRTSNYLDSGLIVKSEEKDFRNNTTKVEIYKYEFY